MERKSMKSFIACFMAALMFVCAISGVSMAFSEEDAGEGYTIRQMDSVTLAGEKQNEKELTEPEEAEMYADDEVVTFIVELDSEAVLDVNGTMNTDGVLTGRGAELNERALEEQHRVAKSIDESITNVDVRYNFTLLINAFSFDAPYGLMSRISEVDGVANVSVSPMFEIPETEYTTDGYYPSMYSAGDMVNLTGSWDLGYTGRGTLVSVVDSGLYIEHEAFSTAPESPKFVKSDIQSMLDANDLQAEKLMAEAGKGLTADDVYYSEKIVYRFDYNGVDTDVGHGRYTDSMDHGTHVTGIVAAVPTTEMNGIEDTYARGMAPQAQIAAMKVFSDHSSGASWDTIIAAIEDSVYIGADVVNLSLGSPSGFPIQEEQYSKIYDTLDEHGISVMTAAGNDTSSAYDSTWGTNFPTTSNVDSGIVNSPATYDDSLAVAAVYNTHKYYTDYIRIGGMALGYTDSALEIGKRKDLLIGKALGGQTLDIVAVPGYGTEEDYAGVDVAGKVAFVIRGNGTFSSKMQVAANHGAIAMVVYDSKENNALTNMQIDQPTIPAVFLSHNNGLYVLECIQGGDTKLYISDGTGAVTEMSNGGVPAAFSSWGPSCDLSIKPEISAPGGNIMSTLDPELTGAGQMYGSMSGTSMATPAISGAAAIVRQYVNEKFTGLSGKEKVELINTLLMCTAVPLKDADGVEYSVRKQGAGMIDLSAALTTTALLTVDDCVRPKLELGSDVSRSGEYTFSYNVYNFGDKPLTYKVEPVMQTSGYVWTDQGTRAANVSTLESTQLTDNISYKTNCENDTVTVAAGATEKITVTMTIDAATHEMLKEIFPYGTYIEGYCYLRSIADAEGAVYPDLSICYLGFYGDWSEVPVVDQSFYYDEPEDQLGMMAYPNTLGSKHKATFFEIGMNPYFDLSSESEEVQKFTFLADRCSISPVNSDRYYDAVDIMYTGIMRNLKLFYYSVIDSTTGEIYWERSIPGEMSKNISTINDAAIYPMGYAINRMSAWTGGELPEGTTALVRCGGEPYMDNFNAEVATKAYWEMPVTIDNTAPYIVESWSEGDTLYVKLADNHYAAYAGVYAGESDETPFAEFCISENERCAETVISFDMSGKEKAYLLLGDYACNEVQFEISAGGSMPDEGTHYELADTIIPGDTYLVVSGNEHVEGAEVAAYYALTSTPAMPNGVRLQGVCVNAEGNSIEGGKHSGAEWTVSADGSFRNVNSGEYLGITESEGTYWLGTTGEANAHWTYATGTLTHDSNLTDAKLLVYSDTIKNYPPQFDITSDAAASGNIRLYHKIESAKETDVSLYAEAAKAADGNYLDIGVKLSANNNVTTGIVTLTYDANMVSLVDTKPGDMLSGGSAQFNTSIAGRITAAFDRGSTTAGSDDETVFTVRVGLECEQDTLLMFEVFANELYNGNEKVTANTQCAIYGGETDSRTPVDVYLKAEVSSENAERVLTLAVSAEDCMNHVLSGGYVVTYDPTVFEYKSSVEGRMLSKFETDTKMSDGRFEFSFTGTEPASSASGNLITLGLQIKSDVQKGTETEIGLKATTFTADDTARINSVKAEGIKYTITTEGGSETPTPVPFETPTDAVVFSMRASEAEGNKVKLSIDVSEESKAACGVVIVSYDASVFEYGNSCIAGSALEGALIVPNATENGKLKIAFASTAVIADEGGEVLIITFNVNNGVEQGRKAEFGIEIEELLAEDTVTEIDAVGIGCEYTVGGGETPTPTQTPAPSETPTATPSETPTATPSATPTATPSATPTNSPTVSPSSKPTEAPTPTDDPSATIAPTVTPTTIPSPTTTPGVPGTGAQVTPFVAMAFAILGIVGMAYYFFRGKEETDS